MQVEETNSRKSAGALLALTRLVSASRSWLGHLGGIGWRLLMRVLLFSSMITLLLTLTQLYLDYRSGVDAIEQRMSEIDSGYRRSLGEGLWRLDESQLRLQVEGILRLPDIRYVEVREVTDHDAPLVVTAGSHDVNARVRRKYPIFCAVNGAERLVGNLSVEATYDNLLGRLLGTALVIMVSHSRNPCR